MSKLRRDVAANAGGGAVLLLGQLLALPLALQSASASEYGTWLAVATMASLLGMADLGMSAALIRFAAASCQADLATRATTHARRVHARLALAAVPVQVGGASVILLAMDNGVSRRLSALMVVGSACGAGVLLLTRHWQAFNQSRSYFGRERVHQTAGLGIRLVGLLICWYCGGGLAGVVVTEILALTAPGVISTVRLIVTTEYTWQSARIHSDQRREVDGFANSWFVVAGATQLAVAAPTIVVGVVASPALATAVGAGVRLANAFRQILNWALEPTFPHSIGSTEAAMNTLAVRTISGVYAVGVFAICGFWIGGQSFVSLWLGSAEPELLAPTYAFSMALLVATILSFLPNCFSIVRQAKYRPDLFRWEIATWALLTPGLLAASLAWAPRLQYLSIIGAAAVGFSIAYLRIWRLLDPPLRGALLRALLGSTAAVSVCAGGAALATTVTQNEWRTAVGAFVYVLVAAVATGLYVRHRRMRVRELASVRPSGHRD